ncbi:16S rRNA (guanine(527)-N(7))-methyltransferase RsmG [Rubrobacter indicoceani]|uniref:16S rRNA (guanine(527)-N(7))-methyltransferase RsmG n=1 Tax=Rubrobacter indicoceani TaxID=2051957 RepID=UPI0013C42BE8|nr:16S rRNA (guanine(527)-N(7))-methyltransferase RsmG [Rubrobacter indicoceani]
MKRNVHELLTEWGLSSRLVETGVLERLQGFGEFLSEYDAANVIGVRDLHQIISEHIVDSLSCAFAADFLSAKKAVDVGSGAGLPGIPLAILYPGTAFTLVDSVGKKTAFQQEAVREIGLANVEPVQMRLEEIGRSEKHRESYGIATSRALASLDVVAEYCLPLLEVGGVALAMKGRVEPEELTRGRVATERLGGAVLEVSIVQRLRGQVSKERSIIVLKKLRKTPHKYPRETGVPKKNPLGDA